MKKYKVHKGIVKMGLSYKWVLDYLFKQRSWLLCILLLLGAQDLLNAQQIRMNFSAKEVKKDLEYLYNTLQASHFNLYAYVPKVRFDSAYQSILESIEEDSLSFLESNKLFQRFTATGNVGHNEVAFPSLSYIAYAEQGGTLFPLELAFENSVAYVRKNFTNLSDISIGAQLISIDGVSINEIQVSMYPYLSAERLCFKNVKIEYFSFPRMLWLVFGRKDNYLVKIRNSSGKVRTHMVEAISVMDFESLRKGEIVRSERFLKYFGDVAYIHPGTFSSTDTIDGEVQFKQFIDSSFAEIRSKNIEKLIVDFRNNGGGHNAYSDYLISYFADKPFRWYSSFQIKTSVALKEYVYQSFAAPEMNDYAKAILNHENGEIFNYEFPKQKSVTEDKRFKGKVYALSNRHSYSMAAVSLALMQDYGFAKILGEETGELPSLYASVFPLSLPRTGIDVLIPKGYIVRPNGSEILNGVLPDIEVQDHLLDEKDEILDYALENL